MTKSAKGDSETPGKNVAQKKGLNKAILRMAPYMVKTSLINKAKEYDRVLIEVDPKYTSQTCSKCGHKDKESREDQETFKCTKCGHEINADHNAAINVLNRSLKEVLTKDMEHDTTVDK
jgi:putative transposase